MWAASTAAGGGGPFVVPVAAAVELLVAGLDVMDDVEDGDESSLVATAGVSQALNVANGLLFLAHLVLTSPGLPLESRRVLDLEHSLATTGIRSVSGQHRDLLSDVDSLSEALEIAAEKSGALAAGACRLGAMLGTEDGKLLSLYGAWGTHFGTMNQLANDLHDAFQPDVKPDVRTGKRTLPLEYVRLASGAGDLNSLDDPDGQAAIEESGVVGFTWVVVEVERAHCRAILANLRALGQTPDELEALLG